MKTNLKSSNFNQLLSRVVMIAFILPCLTISAQDFTKTYQEKYDIDKGAVLVIQNKFGDIDCQTWDDNSVSISVKVKVDASSQEKANRVFDKISVDLSGNRTKVQGLTTVGSINNADFSIDYEIRMPQWINLDLDNKFGDIILGEADGTVKINLEYGAMEANSFNGSATDLAIKFSEVEAGFIKDGQVHIEYSEWDAEGAENLKLYSRFSEITIEKVSELNLDSQYDEINISYAGNVISISRFSELDFDKINGDFDFDIQYGELNLNYITANFKSGKVRNTFADANLTFDPKANMNINAELNFGELNYPRGNTSMNHETVGYTKNIYKGKIGTAATTTSQLSIISKNADVDIDFED